MKVMRAVLLIGWMNPIIITSVVFQWIFSGDYGVSISSPPEGGTLVEVHLPGGRTADV